jgi:predicted dehydrogenase
VHKIGIVGFGAIAEKGHLPALQSFPEIEVTAVADLSAERREHARRLLPDAAIFEDATALLAEADITGVDICSPPATHAALIESACRCGLSTVISEKPFVLTEEEYARVARAREVSGSRIISVNNWMHSHLHRRVCRVIVAGWIGEVKRVELRTGRPDAAKGSPDWMPLWRTDLEHSGGGVILDHGWHQLYLLMSWMDSLPESVACVARTVDPRHGEAEDEAALDLFFPSGTGRIELSWTSDARSNGGLIEGTLGEVEIHDDRIVVSGLAGIHELPFDDRLTQSSYHPEWFHSMLKGSIIPPDSAESDRNFAEAGVLVSTIRAAYRSAGLGGSRLPIDMVARHTASPESREGLTKCL